MRKTLGRAYFDAAYAAGPDPWNLSSDYERAKYAITLEALPKQRYEFALEVGCSIGILTRELASRCDRLLALDAAQAALDQAKRRCADVATMRFEQMFVPGQWPGGLFDLILLSEVVYYMDEQDVAGLASKAVQALASSGDIVLVHWTGETHYPLSGDEAAELFIKSTERSVEVVRQDRYPTYRLDVLSRRKRVASEMR
jgi:cyclopropane fatty-acyl-phospholipid synthase-like methyltransferase